jgi:protein-L-isoaspartate(D-aspartate) O-methyltransferase|tara:strand:- start:287 stop:886 length:600 start_codon:yes stop_codon:yes gene_type:complete
MMLLELRQSGILDDRIYNAISAFSREDFLPKTLKGFSKEDLNLKIFNNIFASKTSDIARMIYLGLSYNNKVRNVLEIGTGSGWQSALLSKIYHRVYTIEIDREAYLFSSNILKNISNKISHKHGDGKLGWIDAGPFDAIYIDCCLEQEPEYLYSNLVKDEGVLVAANKYDNKQYYCSCLPHSGKGLVKSNFEINRTLLL